MQVFSFNKRCIFQCFTLISLFAFAGYASIFWISEDTSISPSYYIIMFILLCMAVLLVNFLFSRPLLASFKQKNIFSEVLDANSKGYAIIASNGRIYYANHEFTSAFPKITYFTDFLDSATSIISGSDKEKLIHHYNNGSSISIPLDHADHDNPPLPHACSLSLSPLAFPSGYAVLFFHSCSTDTNTHTFSPDQLHTAIFEIERDGTIIHMNETCKNLMHVTDIHTCNFFNLLSSRNNNHVIETFKQSHHWKGVITFSTSSKKHVEYYVEHYLDSSTHRLLGFIIDTIPVSTSMLSSDITQNAWDIYLEKAPFAISLLTDDFTIIRSNNVFNTLLLEEDEPHNNINLTDLLSNISQLNLEHYIGQIVNQDTDAKPLDVQVKHNGNKSAQLYMLPLPRSKKHTKLSPTYACYLIDTTEQKNLEIRFAHSQRMQAIGQLAGGIAHDFNNLLTAIIGFCDLLLLRHPAGDRSFSDIMQVKQNSTRAANLVRQLLAFSRKQTLQPEVLNITDVLSEISHLVRRLIGENIQLVMKHGRNIGKTKVDQGQFEQVIINLAVNARDAMMSGGTLTLQTENVTITSDAQLSSSLIAPGGASSIIPGDYIKLEVIDTGSGIPDDVINNIFEPFYTTKEVGSGTGLGLSTVYGIINQTEGYIFVSKGTEKGTVFTIFLKRYTDEVVEGQVSQDDPEDSRDLTGKETILLVEDEDPVRAFSRQALSNKGYHVLDADCGASALELAKEHIHNIDLIITDVMMPGINGPTMIKEIHKQNPKIKVIFISGYAEDAFISSYGKERDFHFLPKPFTLKQLAVKVKEVLNDKKNVH